MAIKLTNLSFSYDKDPVINNFSLELKNNDRVCLTGESGVGKTTLFRLILGLEKQSGGQIQRPEKISVVFQEDRLFEGISVLKNVSVVGSVNGADELIKAAGMENAKNKLPEELSGGMKRRVAILRALNFEADAILLDEPFNGIDDENKKIMANLILEKFGDKPILLITHNKQDASLLGAKTIEIKGI